MKASKSHVERAKSSSYKNKLNIPLMLVIMWYPVAGTAWWNTPAELPRRPVTDLPTEGECQY